jgi:hypothetical protein
VYVLLGIDQLKVYLEMANGLYPAMTIFGR